MVDALDAFDIVLHLTTVGAAQADDSSRVASIYKRHVVQGVSLRGERDHSQLGLVKPIINPHQRSFPIEIGCQGQGDTVFGLVPLVFDRIELDSHFLL